MKLNRRTRRMPTNPTLKEGISEGESSNLRIIELEGSISSLKQQLEISRSREKKLALKLEELGCSITMDVEAQSTAFSPLDDQLAKCPIEPRVSFFSSVAERGGWLIGLLIFQSCSSFILSSNENLLQNHPTIIYYLTMLVGAGGNAGNQASVRVIRGLALGQLKRENVTYFAYREFLMACTLSFILGASGLLRTLLSSHTSLSETFAIVVSLMFIVFFSIVVGASLPLLLYLLKVDPAHSSTTIQVVMDISGVLFTCAISSYLLDTPAGEVFLSRIGVLY